MLFIIIYYLLSIIFIIIIIILKIGTSCDPYVIVCVGKECQETGPVKKNVNPEWNKTFYFKTSSGSKVEEITFQIKDKNTVRRGIL